MKYDGLEKPIGVGALATAVVVFWIPETLPSRTRSDNVGAVELVEIP